MRASPDVGSIADSGSADAFVPPDSGVALDTGAVDMGASDTAIADTGEADSSI